MIMIETDLKKYLSAKNTPYIDKKTTDPSNWK